MKRPFSLLMTLISCALTASANQHSNNRDTIIFSGLDPLMKKYISIKENVGVLRGEPQSVITLKETDLLYRRQNLFKTNSGFFLHIDGTGILFEGVIVSDSTIRFSRIDNTHNINYNASGNIITEGENIYIYGGYGFWKSDGLLKKYNFRDREWDIVPLPKEIMPQGIYAPGIWHDKKNNRVYVLSVSNVNEAILNFDEKKNIQSQTHYLDLQSMQWVDQTPLHQKTNKIMESGYTPMQNDKGIVFANQINVFFLDIRSNKVFKLVDKSLSQTFLRLGLQDMYFLYDQTIYFREKQSGKLDSMIISKDKFKEEPYPIFSWEIPASFYWPIFLALLIAFTLFICTKINNPVNKNHGPGMLEHKKLEFTRTELSLIELLINKSRKQLKADITELNYVLGVKDKNIGLQKKVRSDAIKGINEKFRYLTGNTESLVNIERSAADKRYFEYFIRQEHIGQASKILKNMNEK